jgi:hypothetical protein
VYRTPRGQGTQGTGSPVCREPEGREPRVQEAQGVEQVKRARGEGSPGCRKPRVHVAQSAGSHGDRRDREPG